LLIFAKLPILAKTLIFAKRQFLSIFREKRRFLQKMPIFVKNANFRKSFSWNPIFADKKYKFLFVKIVR
jgi:hypothetical protein